MPEATPAPRVLLRDRDAAAALSVSVRTLYEWRQREGLPFVRVGRAIRYPVAELERWASERLEGGPR